MRDTRRHKNRRQVLALFCLCLGGGLMSDMAMAQSQKLRPVIELSCPEGQGDMGQALCGALQEALQQAVPHALIRPGEDVAPLAGSLAIRLVPGRETRSALEAHLQWKTTQGAGWETGPDVSLQASDVALRPQMMPQLARDLIKASKLPLPALH